MAVEEVAVESVENALNAAEIVTENVADIVVEIEIEAETVAEGEPDTFRRDFTGDEFPSVCSVTRGHPPVWKDRERSAEEVRSRTQPKSGL